MNHAFRAALFAGLFSGATLGLAETTPPAASPSAPSTSGTSAGQTGKPALGKSPAATPAPTPEEGAPQQAVDSLSDGDVQQALELLKGNYLNPQAVSPEGLNRATLQGLLERLKAGASVRPPSPASAPESPFRSEVLDGKIGYVRVGSINKDNLAQFDTALADFASKSITALVLDLRATPSSNDFDLAAEFLKRLTPKGKMLFTVHRGGAGKQPADQLYTSTQDPSFGGIVLTVVDHDTSGAAEVIAGALRALDNALAVGSHTAGEAAEFAELPLHGGKVLRVATAEVKLPENRVIFPSGLKPDIAVDVPEKYQAEVLAAELEKGVNALVYEPEHIRLNEAALVAGVNPEIDAAEEAQKRGGANAKRLHDPALQRAVDLITTIQIFGPKLGKPAK